MPRQRLSADSGGHGLIVAAGGDPSPLARLLSETNIRDCRSDIGQGVVLVMAVLTAVDSMTVLAGSTLR